MHYYKFNVKDWTRDTAHLTVVEEGIYRRLLDFYYETESPIPLETQSVIRRLRLGGHEAELAIILDEFFAKTEDGYRHARCDDELAKYHAKADVNRANGKAGGRPSKPKENPNGFQEEPTDNLNHKPLTTNNINTSSGDDLFDKVVDLYHEILPDLPSVKIVSPKRKAQFKARVKSYPRANDIEWWRVFFTKASESDFMMGRVNKWQASLDYFLQPNGFAAVIEGKHK